MRGATGQAARCAEENLRATSDQPDTAIYPLTIAKTMPSLAQQLAELDSAAPQGRSHYTIISG